MVSRHILIEGVYYSSFFLTFEWVNGITRLFLIATQIWCLARLLPLMVGEKIGNDNQYWKNFLLQLKIVDNIFAPVVSENTAGN